MEYILYKRMSLLFIESDINHREAFRKRLNTEKEKYDLSVTGSLKEAKEVLKTGSIDIVIGSYFLENETIIDLIPLLNEIPLIVTGVPKHIDHLISAIKTGAYDYVVKDPDFFYLKALMITIAKVINLKKLREIAVNSCLDEIQYRAIIQNIPDIVYRIDPGGYFTFINRAVQILEYKPSELIGKHFKQIIHPDDFPYICREEFLKEYNKNSHKKDEVTLFFNERRRGSRRTSGLEVRLIFKSWRPDSGDSDLIVGSVIAFGEISAQGEYRGKSNVFVGTVGIIHDITNRKKAEALLRKLYEAVDQSPISVIITDSRGYIEYVNPLFIRKTGYTPLEMQGKHINILKPAKQFRGGAPDFNAIIASKEKWSGEIISSKKNGEKYWESVMINPIIDPRGHITNYLVIKLDITEQKMVHNKLQKAYSELDKKVEERTIELENINRKLLKQIAERKVMERALKKSEEKFRDFMETASDLMQIVDINGDFTYVNEATSRILGYIKEEMIGMNVKQILSKDILENHYKSRLKELMTNGKISYETKWITKQKKEISGEIKVVAIYDENGNYAGARGVFRDISERRQMEDEKEKLELQLLQSKKLETLGTLAGSIAHDFNNLLTPILGFAEMVQDDVPKNSGSYTKLTNTIKIIYRAKDLIKQILTFSRRIEQQPEPVRIQFIINEVLKLLRATIPDTIEIHQHVDPNCSPIMIDPTQIYQVIFNLCNNAYLAMEKSTGSITIGLSEIDVDELFVKEHPNLQQGRYIRLEIKDTGHGMDKTTCDQIFEPFFTTRKVGKGTGLGLSVVHGIVKSNQGEIFVQSEVGKGTQFQIYFPCRKIEVQDESGERKIKGGNERILFIDDEESITIMMKELLERLGYKVTISTSGNDALNIFSKNHDHFDLVITDQIMPDIIGEQLAGEFSRIHPGMPIILITGFVKEISPERLEKLGIQECILKPMDTYTIDNAIRQVLDKK